MKGSSLVNEILLRQRLTELGSIASWAPHILSGLERFIRTAGDYDLFRVNPIQYATANGLSEAEGIELFVHAAKVGLFEMQWLLICAYCPQVAGSFRELDQVHPRFQCEFCNAVNDVALDDYIQVTFTVSSAVRDIVFRHPEMLSVEDYYLRYNFSKDFKAPHGMTHGQLVAALSRGFADIEAGQQRSFEFDLTTGRFEVLDLSHKLLLIFFANGEPAEPQGTQVRLELGRFIVPDRPTGPKDAVLGDGRFAFRQTADVSQAGTSFRLRTALAIAAASGSSSTLPSSSPIWSSMSRFFPADGCCSLRASANFTRHSWWTSARAWQSLTLPICSPI